jgi:lysine 2,3-aminomutase
MEKGVFLTEEVEPPGIRCDSGVPENSINFYSTTYLRYQEKPAINWPSKTRSNFALKCNKKTKAFRKIFYPGISNQDWNDWRWQLKNRIKNLFQLERFFSLSENELKTLSFRRSLLPLSITPYYASLLDGTDPLQPLRRTVVPDIAEHFHGPGESEDPLGEEKDTPVPGLVHRYPDRVLFLVTDTCSNYCRYCTRSRMVGNENSQQFNFFNWQKAIAYIESQPTVRDVLLSGGDPLTLSDEKLEWLLSRLRRIPHIEFLRIGTKVPVVLPHRITPSLTRILKRYHPLWMSIHFTHPEELTSEVSQACERLANAGIPLGSQTVLLKNINDNLEVMKKLVTGLLRIRVRPYYLYQCDPIIGSEHFRTPVKKGLEIIKGLRGFTTGYAVPTYVIDAPGGGGKIPLLPDSVSGRDGDNLLLKNYKGDTFSYPDHKEESEPTRKDCALWQ